jgi:thiamine biosynthesis lipoprotein ApbE
LVVGEPITKFDHKSIQLQTLWQFRTNLGCRSQPLWQVWSQANEAQRLPSAKEVAHAQRLVNLRAMALTSTSVLLNAQAMALSLNGVAQGYASDLAREALRK